MEKKICNICGNSKRFGEVRGRANAVCLQCKSLERQRAWVDVWNTHLSREIPVSGKTVLLVAPSEPDRKFFAKLGMTVSTLDIRPEAKTDIVMDLCGQSQLTDGAWDIVHCSHVLPHLYDLDAALANIFRAMSPQGVFLSQTPTYLGQPSQEFSDESDTAVQYKSDLLKSQRVGNFRKFGDLGLLKLLQERFVTKTFDGQDPVSERRSMWIAAWKKSAADSPRDIPTEPAQYVYGA